MPFITEEIWQNFRDLHQSKNESLVISSFPQKKGEVDSKNAGDIEWIKQFVTGIRNIKGEMRIPPSKKITSLIQAANKEDQRKIIVAITYIIKYVVLYSTEQNSMAFDIDIF